MSPVTRLASLLALASSCMIDTGIPLECRDDRDCGANECARNGQCATRGSLVSVRLSWTVSGQPAALTSCAPIPELSVAFEDTDTFDLFTFSPVPCELGQIYFNRMHPRYDQLTVTAHDGQGVERDRIELNLSGDAETYLSTDLLSLP